MVQVLTATELRKKIEKENATHFAGCHIKGNVILDLEGLEIHRLCFSEAWFYGKLTIKGGKIGVLCLADATIEGKLDISQTTIGRIDAEGLKVKGQSFIMPEAFFANEKNTGRKTVKGEAAIA